MVQLVQAVQPIDQTQEEGFTAETLRRGVTELFMIVRILCSRCLYGFRSGELRRRGHGHVAVAVE